jgi:DNA-binding beta-propeller fold protein YncE
MIDTNPSSQTFNTIIGSIGGASAQFESPDIYTFAATPDGKYVYLNYFDNDAGAGMLAIFDVVNGGATTISMSSLGADDYQYIVQVSPDGRSLLLQNYYFGSDGYVGQNVMVYDIATNPKNPTLLATITGSVPGGITPYLNSFQVVGNRLFALDTNSQDILAFNFDDVHMNFDQLAVYKLPISLTDDLFTVSSDGALLYLPVINPDMVIVLDANLLVENQPPFITNIATGIYPFQVAVSPTTAKYQVRPEVQRQLHNNRSRAGRLNSLAE